MNDTPRPQQSATGGTDHMVIVARAACLIIGGRVNRLNCVNVI